MNKLMTRLAGMGAVFLMAAGGLQGVATNRYVATNVPGSAYPFDSWAKAGTNIIEVVVAANANAAGDIVFVSNGTYCLTNQISITANVIVTNFTGDRAKVIINGNYSTTTNRCFYMNSVNAIVSGFTITNGYANTNDPYGGGVYLYQGILKDCLVTGNRCVVTQAYGGSGGGGINILAGTADYCSVVGNMAITDPSVAADLWAGGGGICMRSIAGMATNCYVAYNTASNRIYGGGFYLGGGRIYNCMIVGNVAWGTGGPYGGGMQIHSGPNNINDVRYCTIISNRSNYHGGGISIGSTPYSTQIRNCVITANTLTTGYGAGIYIGLNGAPTLLLIESCTIVSNRTDSGSGHGGGINLNTIACITNIWNCIIYDNYANSGPNFNDESGGKNKTSVVYSCTSPDSGFNIVGGITNSPPLFVDAINGNYRLRQDSPCINKGTNRLWMTSTTDRDGNPRIRYGTVDMGAYEYISPGTVYKFH